MRRLVVLVSLSGLAIRLGGLIDRGGVGVGIRNGHAGRAQDAIAELITGLHHLADGGDGDPLHRHLHQCLVEVRVEGVTHFTETGQPVIIGDLLQFIDDELESALNLTVLTSHGD